MGNYHCHSFAPCINCPRKKRVLWVLKGDGKMIQFLGPILVKDLLVNFPGLGVGASRDDTLHHHLPLDYELKSGEVYHLLPSPAPAPAPAPAPEAGVSSMADNGGEQKASGMKRIKVVITKQQLHELLSKQISLEELLLSQPICSSSPRNWKPKLDPIPEGIE